MAFGRSLRRWFASWIALSLLFTQFATAAYACPLGPASQPEPPSQLAMPCASMTDTAAFSPDPDQPLLCIQHCKPSAQTIDPLHAPTATAPAVISMVELMPPPDARQVGRPWLAASRSAERPPPPLSILHCCYRI